MNDFYKDCDYYKVITTDEDRKKLADVVESLKDYIDYKKCVELFGELVFEIYHNDYSSFNNYSVVIYNKVLVGDEEREQYLMCDTFKYDSQIDNVVKKMLFESSHIVECYEFTKQFKK